MAAPDAPARRPRAGFRQLLLRRLKLLGVLAALALAVLGGLYLFWPQALLRMGYAAAAWQANLHSRSIQVGGVRWVYYEGGHGPTLVLLHGFGGSRQNWVPTARYLVNNFHLIIPDLPGYGSSSPVPASEGGIHGEAKLLAGFVQALHLQHFGLVGHSLGGAIAGVYAAQYPQQVFGLALVDSAGLPFPPNAFARSVLAGHDPFVVHDRAGLDALLKLVFLHPPRLWPRLADALVDENRARHAFLAAVFARLRTPADASALVPVLPKLTMPVLGLWCKDDQVIPPSAMQALRQGLSAAPQIAMTELSGCNHMPNVEQPKETAQVLTQFYLLPAPGG